GIVRYVDHGLTSHGDPYIAMDWLEGETLEQRLARGRLAPAGAAHLAAAVLDALAAAHASGIVHRDVKPSNVYLVGWRLFDARLIDFGVARRVEDPKRFTRKGATVGTPSYTSPEQARGEIALDGRADIFSFGCVLFECLTGKPPFSGKSAREVLTSICIEAVPRVAERCEGLDPAFAKLIDSMLIQDRRRRPSSASELASSFRALAARLGAAEDRVSSDTAARPPRGIGFSEQRALAGLLVAFEQAPARAGQGQGLVSSLRDADRLPPRRIGDGEESDESRRPAGRDERLRAFAQELGFAVGFTEEGAAFFSSAAPLSLGDQANAAVALARRIRLTYPKARAVVAVGRALVMGGVLVGELADRLVELCPKVAGPCRLDDAIARLLPATAVTQIEDDGRLLLNEDGPLESNGGGTGVTNVTGPRGDTVVSEPPVAPRVQPGQAPLFGRESESGQLRELLGEVASTERARTLVFTGGPGVGKTRLLRGFVSEARRDKSVAVFFLRGRMDQVNTPFALVAPLAEAFAGLGREAHTVARQAAFVEWLSNLLLSRTCVIVCDDLQWADKASLDLLEVAGRELKQRPFLIVGATRPDPAPSPDSKVAALPPPVPWSRRPSVQKRLPPLSRAAGQALLSWTSRKVSPEMESFVLDRWEGNPFFLHELVRAYADGARDHAPDTVLGVVEARIFALADEPRRVLRAASLFGDSFEFEAVLSLLGLKGRPALEETLARLIDADLIRRLDEARGLYAFRGRLVREAAFAMLSPADRALGMARARQWLEESGKTLPELLVDGPRQPWSTNTQRTGVSASV
ncbi:MAG TPA: AAA family ATPase, partial [Polyangia bacterium]